MISIRFRTLLLALLLAAPLSVAAQPSQQVNTGTTLNLKDAEINSLITTVSELTGINFIVDPRVKGKVTVLSSSPMSPDELYSVFLAVLQVHGFAAVPAGPVTKIVPEVGAKQDGGSYFDTSGLAFDEIVTRVVQISNVPAAQLVPILRPLVPQYGHLAAYSPSNTLIISDRAANVDRMIEIIRRIDQSSDSELEIIRLQYASAADVQRIVQGLTQGSQAVKQAAGQSAVVVLADERTNSVLISGEKTERVAIRALIAHLDIPLEDDGDTQVIYLSFANAETLAPILEGYIANQAGGTAPGQSGGGGGNAGGSGGARGDARVIAEPDINALVITAPPKIMRGLKSVIDQLDIRRAQVLVEAILAEVSISKARQLGIDWAVLNRDRVAAASILDGALISAAAGFATGNTANAALSAIGEGLTIGGGRINEDGTSFVALLNALYGDGDTNVLSTPSLVTMDNQEAEISVGQEVPFLTGSFSNTGGNTGGVVNPFQTIERRDVGLTLAITPQINAGDNIQLEIRQESSNISAGAAGAVDLVTNKRTLQTTVMVDDGDILVLGGLIDDNVQQSEQKIPLLGDIPFLGALFRSTSVNKSKQNLMIFIRPSILRDRRAANFHTARKYDHMRALQGVARDEGTRLLWRDTGPQLEPMTDYLSRGRLPGTTQGLDTDPRRQPVTPEMRMQQPLNLEPQKPSAPREPRSVAPQADPGSRVDEAAGIETTPEAGALRREANEPILYQQNETPPRKAMGRGHLR